MLQHKLLVCVFCLFVFFVLQLLQDVVHSISDNLLFVLLQSNLLVCDTKYNPCLTKEIWIPACQHSKVNAITMVSKK